MSFNFDELLNKGNEAADLVVQNNSEIKAVLDDLEASLARFLGIDIKLVEEIEYEDDGKHPFMRTATIFEPRKRTGYNHISVLHEETGVKQKIMTIKRSNEGYPIVVVDGKNHYSSDNQSEFADAVGSVVTNSQTHLIFRAFARNVKESLEKRKASE
ncbi:hypothetical protein [Vibrio parahaemolyticus]|uniref:hypothetical protein n=1 Tax=Vibrio parahaemolyticus TaxID=670 RepID=UPI0004D3A908|nr:hypothetical protein [Vibrio parahaemolyticus]OQU55955.1 hypothetical protein EN02_000125 [Vibrio parahaemolyticus]